jgi:hypothetical protein
LPLEATASIRDVLVGGEWVGVWGGVGGVAVAARIQKN